MKGLLWYVHYEEELHVYTDAWEQQQVKKKHFFKLVWR